MCESTTTTTTTGRSYFVHDVFLSVDLRLKISTFYIHTLEKGRSTLLIISTTGSSTKATYLKRIIIKKYIFQIHVFQYYLPHWLIPNTTYDFNCKVIKKRYSVVRQLKTQWYTDCTLRYANRDDDIRSCPGTTVYASLTSQSLPSPLVPATENCGHDGKNTQQ